MIIGDQLRALREQQNLSQGDIEQSTGLLRCYVSRVENGHTVNLGKAVGREVQMRREISEEEFLNFARCKRRERKLGADSRLRLRSRTEESRTLALYRDPRNGGLDAAVRQQGSGLSFLQ